MTTPETREGTKHTPGPWKTVTQRDRRGRSLFAVADAEGIIVATVEGSGPVASVNAAAIVSAVNELATVRALLAEAKEALTNVLGCYKFAMNVLHRDEADFEASSEVVAARATLARIGAVLDPSGLRSSNEANKP